MGVTGLAADADATDDVTYTLSNNAGGRFAIHATTGVVTVADNTLLDYETNTSHNVIVRATSTDASAQTKAFTINILDATNEYTVGPISDSDAAPDEVSTKLRRSIRLPLLLWSRR